MIDVMSLIQVYLFTIPGGLIAATLDLLFWFAFAIQVANGARRREDLEHWWQKAFIAYFVFKDWLYNRIWARLLFLEMGRKEDKLLTERLKYILHSGDYDIDEWRFKLALFMCMYLIDPLDAGHCSLWKLEG